MDYVDYVEQIFKRKCSIPLCCGVEVHLSLLTCVLHDVWLTSRSGLLYLAKEPAMEVNCIN